MAWIWIGCALMAAGGLLALTDRRYRRYRATARRRQPAALLIHRPQEAA
jgi:cytochrome c-type biogenesis protein CcmF